MRVTPSATALWALHNPAPFCGPEEGKIGKTLYGAFFQCVILFPDAASYRDRSICSQAVRTGLIESVFWQISDGNGFFFFLNHHDYEGTFATCNLQDSL